jgi:hypothetical protein
VSIVVVENLSALETYSSIVGIAVHFHHTVEVEVSEVEPAELSGVRNLNNGTPPVHFCPFYVQPRSTTSISCILAAVKSPSVYSMYTVGYF